MLYTFLMSICKLVPSEVREMNHCNEMLETILRPAQAEFKGSQNYKVVANIEISWKTVLNIERFDFKPVNESSLNLLWIIDRFDFGIPSMDKILLPPCQSDLKSCV